MKKLKWSKNYIEYVIDLLGVICLSYVILFFVDLNDQLYQALRDIYAAKAIFMFAVFMFIHQRVRLFNWQSLAATALYAPFGYMYRNRFIESPDLFDRDQTVVWLVWILLLIVVDMAVYKKVNTQKNFHKTAFFIFILMTFFMNFYRHERKQPILFVVMLLFYLIPISKEQWKRIVYQCCGAWILSFIRILIRSMRENPGLADNGRWYGSFMNLGDFGIFMASMTVISLFLLYVARRQYGRKSIPYLAGWILLVPVVWTLARVCTLTMFLGIACIFLVGFVVMPKKSSGGYILLRFGIVVLCLAGAVGGGFLLLRSLANLSQDYWTKILKEGNTFVKPFADLVRRAHVVFDKPITFGDAGIFEIGSTINYIDMITSGRLSIIKVFSEYFNFSGNPSFGVNVGEFFSYTVHGTYPQLIFEYGYIGGGLFCVWTIGYFIWCGKQYLQERKNEALLTCLWVAMAMGVFWGEYIMLYSPLIFTLLFLYYPLIVNMDAEDDVPLYEEVEDYDDDEIYS